MSGLYELFINWLGGMVISNAKGNKTLPITAAGHTKGNIMKDKIHPKYETITVRCACGNSFETRSTSSKISLDICSQCHPFFTGKQKLLDIAGRIDKFNKRYTHIQGAVVAKKEKPAPVAEKAAPAADKAAQ